MDVRITSESSFQNETIYLSSYLNQFLFSSALYKGKGYFVSSFYLLLIVILTNYKTFFQKPYPEFHPKYIRSRSQRLLYICIIIFWIKFIKRCVNGDSLWVLINLFWDSFIISILCFININLVFQRPLYDFNIFRNSTLL